MGYLVCFILGGWLGVILMALLVASKEDDPK